MIKRHELLDKLEDIQDSSHKRFMGTNEADLNTREEIATFILNLLSDTNYNKRELLIAFANFKFLSPQKFSCAEECIDAFLEQDFYKVGDFHEKCDDGCKYHCTKGNTQMAECLIAHSQKNIETAYNQIKELYDNQNISGFSKRAFAQCLDIIEVLKTK
jgi:hypothetical protein